MCNDKVLKYLHTEDEKERAFQHKYYLDNKVRLSELRKHKRLTDPKFRQKEIKRSRERRAKARDRMARYRFKSRIKSKINDPRVMRSIRFVEVEGEPQDVYGTAMFGQRIGRDPVTIRVWLTEGVLPGCSIWVGRRAYFSERFIMAVMWACVETLRLNGHCIHHILRRFIATAMEKFNVPYVPKDQKNSNGKGKKDKKGSEAR